MLVCVNGHLITQYASSNPVSRRNFCTDCGGKAIDSCGACNHQIAVRHNSRFSAVQRVPKYCGNCGAAYPWQTTAIENLRAVLQESELSTQDREEIDKALPDVLGDTAKTESAALKVKRILGKIGKPAYEVVIKVVTDVASETAKKTLGLG